MATASCMGGWCRRRDSCAHYVTDDRRVPVERLCEPGQSDAYSAAYAAEKQLVRSTVTYYTNAWTQNARQDGQS